MNILFDAATRQLSIDTDAAQPWGADLTCRIERHGQTVPLGGASFGAVIRADDVVIAEPRWPSEGEVFRQTDQDLIATHRVRWVTGQTIQFDAWVSAAFGRSDVSVTFEVPRSPSPFPSWVYSAETNSYSAPVAMPEGGEWLWDEASLSWVSFSE